MSSRAVDYFASVFTDIKCTVILGILQSHSYACKIKLLSLIVIAVVSVHSMKCSPSGSKLNSRSRYLTETSSGAKTS